jgi:hypothetical protein
MSAAIELDAAIGAPGWRPTDVHPLADLFPMLEPDDLKALAEDIKVNGLQSPVVVDQAGRLVDGRNRLAACDMVQVEPEWRVIQDVDAEAFIWGANVKRRQMTKGQIAMVAAMNLSTDSVLAKAAQAAGISKQYMSSALLIKQYAIDLADQVIIGDLKFDTAFSSAKERKKAAEWRDDGMRMLREVAPDLADRVRDEEISFEEAKKQHEDRLRADHMMCDSVFVGLRGGVNGFVGFDKSDALKRMPEWINTDDGAKLLNQYFPDGIEEAKAKLADAERGLAAAKAVLQQIKRRK